ncbi:hypothetical protein FGO68_gene16138 [Halteria grandinella]|uniref:Uncharacterized protein n=1 Tax=Halteria grandinella TaxID=5974 RepID=A0A8J8T583_HALGN|nr:hypothetical protein FGO68_gene16138 [Halteria grandinella]
MNLSLQRVLLLQSGIFLRLLTIRSISSPSQNTSVQALTMMSRYSQSVLQLICLLNNSSKLQTSISSKLKQF